MRRVLGSVTAVLFLALGTVGTAQGASDDGWKIVKPRQDRIVNADGQGLIPWQVGIAARPQSNGQPAALPAAGQFANLNTYCGGTLRDSTHVITAAHCLPDDPGDDPGEIVIFAGAADRTQVPTELLRAVTVISSHPDYRGTSTGADVAVLTISPPLTGGSVAPRPVIAANAAIATGQNALISGWGHIQEGGTTQNGNGSPAINRYAQIEVYADAQCAGYQGAFLASSMICAGYQFVSQQTQQTVVQDTCQGDSGGPLMQYNGQYPPSGNLNDYPALLGVVSFGRGCAQQGFPGIYTKLTDPSNHAVATAANPVARVKRAGDPAISKAGSTITCTAAAWGNSPTSTTPVVLLLTGTVEGQSLKVTKIEEKPGRSYTTTTADNGKFAQCEERATNAGGSLVQESGIIQAPDGPAAPPAPTPTPSPAPAPTATPTPGPIGGGGGNLPATSDLTAPTSSVSKRSCAKRVCSLTIKIADKGGADLSKAKLRVTVTQLTGCPKGKSKKAKACKKAKTATARKSGTGTFTIKTAKLRKGRVRIVIRATDAAGNEQAKPTTVTLTIR